MAIKSGFDSLQQNYLSQKTPAAFYGRKSIGEKSPKTAVYRGESLSYFLHKNGVPSPVNNISNLLSLNKIGDPRELVPGVELLLP